MAPVRERTESPADFPFINDIIPTRERAGTGATDQRRRSRIASLASTFFGENDSLQWAYTDVIDPYTKASDAFCTMSFLAISLGPGSLYLPGAMTLCGYVPGAFLLCLLYWLQVSLAHRIIEAPAVLRMDLDLYIDIAKACLNPPHNKKRLWQHMLLPFCKVMNVVALFGACVVNLLVILWSLCRIRGTEQNDMLLTFTVCLMLLLVPIRFSRHIRHMGRASKVCVLLMHLILFIVVIFGLKNRVWQPEPIKYTAFGTLEGVFRGLARIGYAFSGLQYLPYIFSDMYAPQNAALVCSKAYRHAFIFFVSISFFSYLGWGDSSSGEGTYSLLDNPDIGRIIACIMVVQAFMSYPLLFAPLARTTEYVLKFESEPAVDLGLPWAIRALRYKKKAVQVGLVFGGLVAELLLTEWASKWILFVAWTAGNFTERIFPAIFSIVLDSRERSWENFDMASGRTGLQRARDSLMMPARDIAATKQYRWLMSALSLIIGLSLLSWGTVRSVQQICSSSANASTVTANITNVIK